MRIEVLKKWCLAPIMTTALVYIFSLIRQGWTAKRKAITNQSGAPLYIFLNLTANIWLGLHCWRIHALFYIFPSRWRQRCSCSSFRTSLANVEPQSGNLFSRSRRRGRSAEKEKCFPWDDLFFRVTFAGMEESKWKILPLTFIFIQNSNT